MLLGMLAQGTGISVLLSVFYVINSRLWIYVCYFCTPFSFLHLFSLARVWKTCNVDCYPYNFFLVFQFQAIGLAQNGVLG